MPESTEELHADVQASTDELAEAEMTIGQLNSRAIELSDQAAGHGWNGMAVRMHECADHLEAANGQVMAAEEACENAVQQLAMITPKVPAQEVTDHLATSSAQLGEAVTAIKEAVAQVDEARVASEEVGQEGMIATTADLHQRLSEVVERLSAHQVKNEGEHAAAVAYATAQAGN